MVKLIEIFKNYFSKNNKKQILNQEKESCDISDLWLNYSYIIKPLENPTFLLKISVLEKTKTTYLIRFEEIGVKKRYEKNNFLNLYEVLERCEDARPHKRE
jgi:hypothetical protein